VQVLRRIYFRNAINSGWRAPVGGSATPLRTGDEAEVDFAAGTIVSAAGSSGLPLHTGHLV